MTTKSYNRSSILRAAWASARYIADLVGESVLRHIGAAMRNCWYIAKHGRAAFADAPSMMQQPAQQQQAKDSRNHSAISAAPAAADTPSIEYVLTASDRGAKVFWNGDEFVRTMDTALRYAMVEVAECALLLSKRVGFAIDFQVARSAMIVQPCQQQQARARNDANWRVRINALGHLGFPCDPDHADASLWIVTDGQISRDCATHQEALDLADESRGLGYIPAIVPRLPQKGSDLRSAMMTYDEAKAACVRATWGREFRGLDKTARADAARVRLLDLRESGSVDQAVFDRLKAELVPAPVMVPQPCQQQQACAARPIPEQPAPAVPPHLSPESEVDHGWYISEILAEMMDDEPARPRPQPTVMETVVGRAFTDGLMLGRQMAIGEIETLFAELIAQLRKN